MLAAEAPEQITIPKVPETTIRKRAEQIRPIMRFKESGNDNELVLNAQGIFYYLKPVDLFKTAFTWPGSPEADTRAPRLQKLRTIKTYHTWAYYGFFKPTIAEVLSQIPEDIIDQVIAFELEPPEDPLKPWDIVQHGHHVAETTFYGLRAPGEADDTDEEKSGRVLSDSKPEGAAIIREIDGQIVLDDPVAAAVINVVDKHNCKATLEMNLDRVAHFKQRVDALGKTAQEVVITLINVDDPNGSEIADALMPGANWQEFRDQGQVPFARGLAMRDFIQEALEFFDKEAAAKLQAMTELAVVIVDHGVAEVYPA